MGTSSAKFLDSNDITVTKFLDSTVTKFLMDRDTAVTKFLEANDVSVTKFLETALANFLLDDTVVTNFLEQNSNDITVTKFLDENDLLPNATEANVAVDQDDHMMVIQFLEQ